jgi:hypothetical protein
MAFNDAPDEADVASPAAALQAAEGGRSYALAHMGTDVCIADVERRFGVAWTEVRTAEGRIIDPLYSARLRTKACLLLADMVNQISARIGALPTLCRSMQNACLSTSDVQLACNQLWSRVCPWFTDPSMTREGFKMEMRALYVETATAHVNAARRAIVEHVQNIQSLQRVLRMDTAELGQEMRMEAALETHLHAVRAACSIPSSPLFDEFARAKVPLLELCELLSSTPLTIDIYVTGASALAPSGIVRNIGIARWIAEFGTRAHECCAAAIKRLFTLHDKNWDEDTWSGLRVLTKSQRAAAFVDGGAVVDLDVRAPITAAAQFCAVPCATPCSASVAIHPVAVARVLLDLVNKDALAPRTYSAALVAGIAARAAAEAHASNDSYAETAASASFAHSPSVASELPDTLPSLATVVPSGTRTSTAIDEVPVPNELSGMHAVLQSFADVLEDIERMAGPVEVRIPLGDVTDRVAQRLPDMNARAATQLTSHVLRGVQRRLAAYVKRKGGALHADAFVYTKPPTWRRGAIGLSTSPAGRAWTVSFVAHLLLQMRTDQNFATAWMSAASRSRARRKKKDAQTSASSSQRAC